MRFGQLVEKAKVFIARHGALNAARELLSYLAATVGLETPKFARRRVSRLVLARYGHEVIYGPFKGMRLPTKSWWGESSSVSKLLGNYESEVVEELTRESCELFVDIGAADGFFAVGLVYSGFAGRCIAFDTSEFAQTSIKNTALLNQVAEKIQTYGEFSEASVKVMTTGLAAIHGRSLALIDIEGGEFELLTPTVWTMFREFKVIIEIHNFFFEDGETRLKNLLSIVSTTHKTRVINQSFTRFNAVEMDDLTNDESVLLLSEGRRRAMKWLVCEPHSVTEG